VTRGHNDDESVLRWAVEADARYIEMIGSKKTIRIVVRKLESEGIPSERLGRVHMPIGLDIGAIAPEEIAVAIVAEMIHYPRRGQKDPLSKKTCETSQS
jgi:xanthine dehydrogenase accessory factor